MQSELDRVSAEIDEATRCMGDGLDELAAHHLATAAALLETLVQNATGEPKPATTHKPRTRLAVA